MELQPEKPLSKTDEGILAMALALNGNAPLQEKPPDPICPACKRRVEVSWGVVDYSGSVVRITHLDGVHPRRIRAGDVVKVVEKRPWTASRDARPTHDGPPVGTVAVIQRVDPDPISSPRPPAHVLLAIPVPEGFDFIWVPVEFVELQEIKREKRREDL